MYSLLLEDAQSNKVMSKGDKGDYDAKNELAKEQHKETSKKNAEIEYHQNKLKQSIKERDDAAKQEKDLAQKTGVGNVSTNGKSEPITADASPYADVFTTYEDETGGGNNTALANGGNDDNKLFMKNNNGNPDLDDNETNSHVIAKSDVLTEKSVIHEDFSMGLYPVFVVCSYLDTPFEKLLVKAQKNCSYGHAGLSLDVNLNKMYTYTASTKTQIVKGHGFAIDNLRTWLSTYKTCKICVSTTFLTKEQLYVFRTMINYYMENAASTKYNWVGLFRVLLHKINNNPNSMNLFCSQFVEYMFSLIKMDFVNKSNQFTTPQDLANANLANPKVYKIFEGDGKDYNPAKIQILLKKIERNAIPLKEGFDFYSNGLDKDEWTREALNFSMFQDK